MPAAAFRSRGPLLHTWAGRCTGEKRGARRPHGSPAFFARRGDAGQSPPQKPPNLRPLGPARGHRMFSPLRRGPARIRACRRSLPRRAAVGACAGVSGAAQHRAGYSRRAPRRSVGDRRYRARYSLGAGLLQGATPPKGPCSIRKVRPQWCVLRGARKAVPFAGQLRRLSRHRPLPRPPADPDAGGRTGARPEHVESVRLHRSCHGARSTGRRNGDHHRGHVAHLSRLGPAQPRA